MYIKPRAHLNFLVFLLLFENYTYINHSYYFASKCKATQNNIRAHSNRKHHHMYSILRMTLIHAMTIASKIKKREEKILGVTKKKTFFL